MLFEIVKALTTDIHGKGRSSSFEGSEYAPYSSISKPDKNLTRGAERFLKDVAPPLGSALEILNNAGDSADNLREALNPANRIDHALRDLTVEEALAEIIRRAASRLGEDEYNLVFNNCENFATWCRLGEGI